ncbi:MAG: hypothetical protein QXL57_07880 [Candidatus Bathyarchaeia archaeon]
MTEVKTVKVGKDIYERLCEVAGELQVRLKRPVSLDEAMRYLLSLERRKRGVVISDLAGSWDMSDEEWVKIKASLAEAWKKWIPLEIKS